MITHFGSVVDYFRFSAAKEFLSSADNTSFAYEKNLIEKIGNYLTYPIFRPTDSIFKNINKPHVVTAITLAGVAITTFVFYPTESSELLVKLIPPAANIEPWMIKFAGYCFTQSIITGVGLRALGRLSNTKLMTAWDNKAIVPIQIGTIIVPQNHE